MRMELDHCGRWVTKRNLNLENFLRKLGKEFGFPRYYETCALESKGVLSLRHVVVTDTTLLFTENVPKNVILFIPLKDIRNIEVVADRKALLKSGKTQPCICQHVQLHCYSASTSQNYSSIQSTTTIWKQEISDDDAKSTTPTNLTSLLSHPAQPPDSDSSCTDFSRQSSRLNGSFLPPGFFEAYESPVVPALPPLLFRRGERTTVAGSTTSSSSSNSTHLGVSRVGRTRESTRAYHNHHHRPRRNWSESGSASELDVGSSGGLNHAGRHAEIMGEKGLVKSGEEKVGKSRPRSLDHVSRLKQKMLRLVLRGGGENSISHPAKSLPPNNTIVLVDPPENQGLYVDFYLYRPNSVMLNELFLFWNRERLKTLLKEDAEGGEGGRNLRGLSSAEKAFSKLSHLFGNPRENQKFQDDFLPKFVTTHKALVKYDHLSRILWKDWALVTHFLSLLKSCLTPENREKEDEDSFVDRLFSIAVLMDIFRLLIEATGPSWFLRRATDKNNNNSNNNTNNNNNQDISSTEEEEWSTSSSLEKERSSQPSTTIITSLHELMSTLARIILSSPDSILPPTSTGGKELVKEIVCKPRKFAEGRWLGSTDTKAVKAVSLVHNTSVALLNEILSIVHFSPKDKNRAKFMSHLQEWPGVESYLLLSMTQILNLLWDNGETLGASQIVMLYRLVHTVQTLTAYYVPSTMQFLRDNFSEEFRYFVHEDSANKKILDRYPLKPTLLSMCEQLRQEIIDK